MAAKIISGDEVIVLTGKRDDKGKHGKVLKVLVEKHKVIVEGLNMVTKHVKANQALEIEGKIIKKEAPIDISNVAIFNPKTGKADRVGFKFVDGKKVRFYKSTQEIIVK